MGDTKLEDYEEEKLTLEYVSMEEALYVNRFHDHGDKTDGVWIERESRVMELLSFSKF